MTLGEWFNVKDLVHLMAYQYLSENGHWPERFIPEDIKIGPIDIIVIQNKLADAYIKQILV